MGFWSKLWRKQEKTADADLPLGNEILGYRFRDPALLREALTHRSYANANDSSITYERLEFLGDSVLGMIVARFLYRKYPAFSEGELTKAKASLVNIRALTKVAKKEGLGAFIKLSPEEDRAGGRNRASILSDVLEAVIGAVCLDGGITAAADLVERILLAGFSLSDSRLTSANYKGDLLELLQGEGRGLPRYTVVNEEGPDHEKVFTVAVYAGGRECGRGVGSSKKDAEQHAARRALEALRKTGVPPGHASL